MNHKKAVKLKRVYRKMSGFKGRLFDGVIQKTWKNIKREYNKLNWKEKSTL